VASTNLAIDFGGRRFAGLHYFLLEKNPDIALRKFATKSI